MKYRNINFTIRCISLFIFLIVFQTLTFSQSFKKYHKKRTINTLLNELLYNESPIGIDYGQFDEDVRNLQLLGKLSSNNSLIIKPYYPEHFKNIDSILFLLDNSLTNNRKLVNKKYFKINLLPISFTGKYNSDHPYGWNDGSLNYSKGFQYKLNTGLNFKIFNIDLNINPEYLNISNDNYFINKEYGSNTNSFRNFNLGNSSFRFNISKLSFGVANNNLWFGAGQYNALLISNNAPGFLHGFISTNRPMKILIGNLQFSLISGILKFDSTQSLENYSLIKKQFIPKDRYVNTFVLSFQPFFTKNLFFEIERQFQNYNRLNDLNTFSKFFPVFNGVTTEQFDDKNYAQDQQIVLGSRWLMQKSNMEYYIQFGWNDGKKNLRDLAMDLAHSSAYILGIKKLIPISNTQFFNIAIENYRSAQTPSYLHRNAGTWYEHSQIKEGLTNLNQIIGAGIGMGDNADIINISYNKNLTKYEIGFTRIFNNPNQIVRDIDNLGIRDIIWKDLVYSFNYRKKINKKLVLNINSSFVLSKNYAWEFENNRSNLFLMSNLTYLW